MLQTQVIFKLPNIKAMLGSTIPKYTWENIIKASLILKQKKSLFHEDETLHYIFISLLLTLKNEKIYNILISQTYKEILLQYSNGTRIFYEESLYSPYNWSLFFFFPSDQWQSDSTIPRTDSKTKPARAVVRYSRIVGTLECDFFYLGMNFKN